jgi:hypothetical protein
VSYTIYFIHGTGVRDVAATIQQLRERGARLLAWKPEQIVPIEWGRAKGPEPLDISPALPPSTRGAQLPGAPIPEDPAALWKLLMADPYAELRVLAVGPSMTSATSAGAKIDPTAQTLSTRILQRLQSLTLDHNDAAAAGVSAKQVSSAGLELARSSLVATAANKAGSLGQIAEVASRATVAIVLSAPLNDDSPPPLALYDPAARDNLVIAVANALDPDGQRGIFTDAAKRVVGEIATKVAMQRRQDFMGPLSNFLRDVSFYLQHGAVVRDYIAKVIRDHSGDSKVVVLGHSLGGIAAVDLLADPAAASGAAKLPVDLLITVGSQAPYLYLMDSLASLSPTKPDAQPFQPWLNIYNPEDLLSFCAQRVFPAATNIHDVALKADVPFPASHSAYWAQDSLYNILEQHLPS